MTIPDRTVTQVPECPDSAIRVTGVSKRFGRVQALDDVSLEIKSGIVFALLGPNGSGKTTLVKILTTLLRPDQGTAVIGGFDTVRQPAAVRPLIGLAGQYPAVDENLTGRENLTMIGRLYHMGTRMARERTRELLEAFDLVSAADRNARTYSGGMRRRLDLAAALVGKPSILFLDEPTTGLDPRSRLSLWDVISAQARDCKTVFLTTQYLEEADRLANQVAIMDAGRVIRTGTPKELKECCGGETHVALRLTDRSQASQALKALGDMGGKVYSDSGTGEITLPAPGGTAILAEVVRRLDSAGVRIAELGLKQPTLDDVFLSITGRPAIEQSGKEDSPPGNSKDLRR